MKQCSTVGDKKSRLRSTRLRFNRGGSANDERIHEYVIVLLEFHDPSN